MDAETKTDEHNHHGVDARIHPRDLHKHVPVQIERQAQQDEPTSQSPADATLGGKQAGDDWALGDASSPGCDTTLNGLAHAHAAQGEQHYPEQAEDDIDVRYATKAHKVAEKEYELNQDLDRKRKGAVPFVELERLRLDAERAALAIEKAGNDRELAKFDYWTKRTEFEAAEKAIERRNILAPTKGEVVKLFRQQGEWVNPGDPILLSLIHI